MKLCWDNIESVYLTKNGNLRHVSRGILFEKDQCIICGDPYLGKQKEKTCSRECSHVVTANAHRGMKRSDETRKRISESTMGRVPYNKHNFDYIKDRIEAEGYILLNTEYKSNKKKLTLICPGGHQWLARWDAFQSGSRCYTCFGKPKHSYTYIKDKIETEGCFLISKQYKGAFNKIKIQCSEGHIFSMKFNNFQQGQRCPECRLENMRLSFEYVKELIEKEGYSLLSTNYINCKEKLKLKCNEGHIYNASYNCFQQGERCPICYANCQTSKLEKEVLDIVKKFTKEFIIENDRTQLINPITNRYLELDIWIPSLNKAIEFNGEYWHKNNVYKDKQKLKQCKDKDISLMVIKEEDWKRDKDICINSIKEWLE